MARKKGQGKGSEDQEENMQLDVTQIRGESGALYKNITLCSKHSGAAIDPMYLMSSVGPSEFIEELFGEDPKFYMANSNHGKVFIKLPREKSTEREFYDYLASRNAHHPMLVPLEDVILHEGTEYLVFQFIPFKKHGSVSKNLSQLLLETPFGTSKEGYNTILSVGIAIADFLEFMNQNLAIDLDIKPGNILCCPNDAVYELRKCDLEGAKIGTRDKLGRLNIRLGKTDQKIYTPSYSPPELLAPEPHLTPYADVYSLGCILYEMFNGVRAPHIQQYFASDSDLPDFKLLRFTLEMKGDYSYLRKYGILTPLDVQESETPMKMKPIIARCLELLHVDRYLPGELKQELEKMMK